MPDALPYLVPSEHAIRAGAWTTDGNETRARLPAWLEDWDLAQHLRARREFEIDLDTTYRETRLPENVRLGVSVVVISDFEHEAFVREFDGSEGTVATTIELDVPGHGKAVELSTTVILKDGASRTDRPIAWRPGSVLWSDVARVNLYGAESQFPVSEVDFSQIGLDPAAPWFLDIGSDLDLPAMGSIHLLVNTRFPRVCEALRTDDIEREDLAVIRSELFADVGRTLVEGALTLGAATDEWVDDSVGAALSNLLRSRFTQSTSDLQNLRDQDPSKWAAAMASTFGRLREPLP